MEEQLPVCFKATGTADCPANTAVKTIKAMALGSVGVIVANIVLFSVLIYELVGPFLTKIALSKAGEIDPEGQTSNRIKHHDKTVPTTKI